MEINKKIFLSYLLMEQELKFSVQFLMSVTLKDLIAISTSMVLPREQLYNMQLNFRIFPILLNEKEIYYSVNIKY